MRKRVQQKHAGFTLVATIIAVGIAGFIGLVVARMMQDQNTTAVDMQTQSTYRRLVSYYQAQIQNRRVVKATIRGYLNPKIEAAGFENDALRQWMNSRGTTTPDAGTLNVYRPTGATLIPHAGLYFTSDGNRGTTANHAFHVQAFWTGRPGGSYELSVLVKPNSSAGIDLSESTHRMLDTRRTQCFVISEGWVNTPNLTDDEHRNWRPSHGHANHLNIGGTMFSTKPPDSLYTKVRITCPAGTTLASAYVDGGCSAKNAHVRRNLADVLDADTRNRTAECRQWTVDMRAGDGCYEQWVVDKGMPPLKVYGVRCEAVCCAFGA